MKRRDLEPQLSELLDELRKGNVAVAVAASNAATAHQHFLYILSVREDMHERIMLLAAGAVNALNCVEGE